MAMHLSRKIILQVSTRRLMAGTGTGGDLGRAHQGARSYHCSNNHDGYYESFAQWLRGLPKIPGAPGLPFLFAIWINDKLKKQTERHDLEKKQRKQQAEKAAELKAERKDRLRKRMQEKGVTRELLEAKIEKLKRKIESGSDSEAERTDLRVYERLLKLSTSGLS